MSVIYLTINEFELTQEEIDSIRIKRSCKQLALALLFKYYQKSHQSINDLTKLPAYLINQVANQFNIPPVISNISLYGCGIRNFIKFNIIHIFCHKACEYLSLKFLFL